MTHSLPTVARAAGALLVAAAAVLVGCNNATPTGGAAGGATATRPGPSALGDLSAFRAIADRVAAQVERNDLVKARATVKELELAWDEAEAGLKPRAVDDWHALDIALDQTLEALRADPLAAEDCRVATRRLLQTFDRLQGRAAAGSGRASQG